MGNFRKSHGGKEIMYPLNLILQIIFIKYQIYFIKNQILFVS